MADGHVSRCGICGCPNLVPVLDLGDQPLPQARPGQDDRERYPLRLVECQECTLVQLSYIVPQRELFPPDYPYSTGNTRALREHFREQARLVDTMIWDNSLVVDIGGNDGTMLKALREEAADSDVRLVLVEPTDQARGAGYKHQITIIQDYWTADLAAEIRAGHGLAAVITASNVFGHVPDPHDFLHGVTGLLHPDGTLIIDNQDWYNVVNDLQIDTVYHEHLRYYSPASLTYLLSQHGLIVTSLTRIAMHGGSFRAIARRQKTDLKRRAWLLGARLQELLAAAAQDGPVYAIGAPTRATSLVNYAGIGTYLDCACEIAGSGKIGARIPGTKVPIVDEKALFADQPPHALLLAWDLAGSLIPALRDRGYKGKIIIPLPEPRYADD